MEALIDFARGPLFAATFAFMIVGLGRQVFLQLVHTGQAIGRLSHRRLKIRDNLRRMIEWLVPVGHIYNHRPFVSGASVVFHLGLLIVPVFLVNHIDLWRQLLGFGWPGLPMVVADALSLLTIVAAVCLFVFRLVLPDARPLSEAADYFLLIALCVPFVSGYMLVHPGVNPLSYNAMMLTHLLSAEMVFILVPTTKLAHCVLFPFNRFSSEVYWKMPVGAGAAVARELRGEGARV